MLLYLHIPFCDSKCNYCAFNSYVDKFHLKQKYMDTILVQLAHELKRFEAQKKSIKTLFIGGGTPSCVEAKLYTKFFDLIKPYLEENAEITTEANPNSASLAWLKDMKNLGVNRVSFGVQSFDDEKLKFLGRNHSKKQAINAVQNAFDIGIKNISLDLIYATSKDTKELLEKDIQTAFSLPINHISSYALSIEKHTKFQGRHELSNDSADLAKEFISLIKKRGFKQYEISNFGSYKSKHNLGYWSGLDYIGVGAGAVGFLKNQRFYPHTDIQKYIDTPLDIKVENLSEQDLHVEKIFLGLRSEIGLKKELFSSKELEKISLLEKEKKLTCKNNIFYNNEYLLSDEIALYIIS